MARLPRLAAAALLLALLFSPAAAQASGRGVTESASLGRVTAQLSYTKTTSRLLGVRFSNIALRIERDGNVLFSGAVAPLCPDCAPPDPGGAAVGNRKSIAVTDLDGDGEPEVVVAAYTGGAHCCEYALIYHLALDGRTYLRTDGDFGNPGYRLADVDHDGRVEIVSEDDRFAYEFTAYAWSVLPVRIWHYTAGTLIDVTGSFPRLIAADARRNLRGYRRERHDRAGDVRGVVAAYVADQYLLGHPAAGWRLVNTALRRHELRSDSYWSGGRAYMRHLRSFLTANGYTAH